MNEYCWKCKPKKPLKKSVLRKTFSKSPKDKRHYDIIESVNIPNGEGVYNNIKMRDFFLGIWNKRFPHECFMCKKKLGNEAKSYFFDHCLEKGVEKYRHLMYNEDNIFYLCLECHDEKTRGFIPDIYKIEIEKLKTKYNLL